MLDHVLGGDSEQSNYEKTSFIVLISIIYEEIRKFVVYECVNVRRSGEGR